MSETKLKYAIFCREVKKTGPGEFDIFGAKDAIEEAIKWTGSAPRPDRPPVWRYSSRVLIGLENISRGNHKVWVVAVRPSKQLEDSSPPTEFLINKGISLQHILINFEIDIVENGEYIFRIMVDGEPLGEIAIPVLIHWK